MEQPILIIASLTLIGIVAFLALYLTNEKKKKTAREAELSELKELISTVQDRIQANSKQATERFEQLQTENINVRKEFAEKVAEIKTAFKDYSENVKEVLNKYANDNAEIKKETEQLKEQMHKELQSILKEIKTPLDLD